MFGHLPKLKPNSTQALFLDKEKAFLAEYQAGEVLAPDPLAPMFRHFAPICRPEVEAKLFVEINQPERNWCYALQATAEDYAHSLATILAKSSFSEQALSFLLCYSLSGAGHQVPACVTALLRYGANLAEFPQTTQNLFERAILKPKIFNMLLAVGGGVLARCQEENAKNPLQLAIQELKAAGGFSLTASPPAIETIRQLLHYATAFPEDNALWRREDEFWRGGEMKTEALQGSYPDYYLTGLLRLCQSAVAGEEAHPADELGLEDQWELACLCFSYQQVQKEAPRFAELWGQPAKLSEQVPRALQSYAENSLLSPAESETLTELQDTLAQLGQQPCEEVLASFKYFRTGGVYKDLPLQSALHGFIFHIETQLMKVLWRAMLPAPVSALARESVLESRTQVLQNFLAAAIPAVLPRPLINVVASYAVEEDKEFRQHRDDLIFLKRYQDPLCLKTITNKGHLISCQQALGGEKGMIGEFDAMYARSSRFWEFALRAAAQNYSHSLTVLLNEGPIAPVQASILLFWTLHRAPDACFYECAELARLRGANMEVPWMQALSRELLQGGQWRKFEFILGLGADPFWEPSEGEDNLMEAVLAAIDQRAGTDLPEREAFLNLLLQHALAFPQHNARWSREGVYHLPLDATKLAVKRAEGPDAVYPDCYVNKLLYLQAPKTTLIRPRFLPPCEKATLIAYQEVKRQQAQFEKSWEQEVKTAESKAVTAMTRVLKLVQACESGAFSQQPLSAVELKVLQALKVKVEASISEREALQALESFRREIGLEPDKYSAALQGLALYAQMKIRQTLWEQLAPKSSPSVPLKAGCS